MKCLFNRARVCKGLSARTQRSQAAHARSHTLPRFWAFGLAGIVAVLGAIGAYRTPAKPSHDLLATRSARQTKPRVAIKNRDSTLKASGQKSLAKDVLTVHGTHYVVLVPTTAAQYPLSGTIHDGQLYWLAPPSFSPSKFSRLGILGIPLASFAVKTMPVPPAGSTINPQNAKTIATVPQNIPGQTTPRSFNEPYQIFVTHGALVVVAANTTEYVNDPLIHPVYVLRPHQPRWQLLTLLYAGGGSFAAITAGHGYILWSSGVGALGETKIVGSASLYNIATGVTQSIATPGNIGVSATITDSHALAAGVLVPFSQVPRPEWTTGSSGAPNGSQFPAYWPTIRSVTKATETISQGGFVAKLMSTSNTFGPSLIVMVREGTLARPTPLPPPKGTWKIIQGIPVQITGQEAWWQQGGYRYYIRLRTPPSGLRNPAVSAWVERAMEELPPWGNPGGPHTSGTVDAYINNFQNSKTPWTHVTVTFRHNNGDGLPLSVEANSFSRAIEAASSLIP